MAEQTGILVEVISIQRGSTCVGGAAALATSLTVEDSTDYQAGAQVSANGATYTVTSIAGSTLTVSPALAAAVADGEPVWVLLNGTIAEDTYGIVDLSDDITPGTPIRVPITDQAQQAVYPIGQYDPPLPVTISTAMDAITGTPGARVPQTIDDVEAVATAAQTTADTAQASADGKSTIRYLAAAPTAATPGVPGDTAWVFAGALIKGHYQCTAGTGTTSGNVWASRDIDGAVLANLDAGSITVGVLSGIEIDGVTITGSTLYGGTPGTTGQGYSKLAYQSIPIWGTSASLGTADGGALTLYADPDHFGTGTGQPALGYLLAYPYNAAQGGGTAKANLSLLLATDATGHTNIGACFMQRDWSTGQTTVALVGDVVKIRAQAANVFGNTDLQITGKVEISQGLTVSGTTSLQGGSIAGNVTFTGGNINGANGNINCAALGASGGVSDTSLSGGGTTAASINNAGHLVRTSSSKRFKSKIRKLATAPDAPTAAEVLALEPRRWTWNTRQKAHEVASIGVGFIAEEADQIPSLRRFIAYRGDNGQPESFWYEHFAAVGHQIVLRDLNARDKAKDQLITDLQQQIANLTTRLVALEAASK